jgi:hypothetical protein
VDIKNDIGQNLFAFGNWYKSWWGIVLGFIPLGLAILGFSKKKWTWVFIGMAIVGAWLLVNSNPPLGWLYDWCSKTIPLFGQVFRWGSSKFWIMWWLPVVILATGGIMRIWKWKKLAAGLVVAGLLVYIFPIFTGKLINNRDWVKIPAEYYDLRNYLGKIDTKGRIYLAPEANMLYFRNYSWGFFGSVFWSYWIPNPVIEKALVTGSVENETAFTKIVNFYYSDNPELFTKVLNNADVKWVIGDKSLTNKEDGYAYNWDSYQKVLEKNPSLEKVWSEGNLELYRVGRTEVAVSGEGTNFNYDLGEGKTFGTGVIKTSDGYEIDNKDNTSGVYWDFSSPDIGGRLLKITGEVENRSGVVAEINLRETKKQYQTFSYYGKLGEKESALGYVYLPSDWRNYLIEFIVRARGPDESVNVLRNLKIESVPLTDDYLAINKPSESGWQNLKYVTYAGWTADILVVVFLLVRQKLKSRKTNLSGNKKTTVA